MGGPFLRRQSAEIPSRGCLVQEIAEGEILFQVASINEMAIRVVANAARETDPISIFLLPFDWTQ